MNIWAVATVIKNKSFSYIKILSVYSFQHEAEKEMKKMQLKMKDRLYVGQITEKEKIECEKFKNSF